MIAMKAFLSDQCKEIEENNRMENTRDLFKKMWDTKEIFHAEMGKIKDINSKELTEADDIKKWQEYTEELYKEDFMTQITTMVWSLTWIKQLKTDSGGGSATWRPHVFSQWLTFIFICSTP